MTGRSQATTGATPTVADLLAEASVLSGEEASREAEVLLCAALAKPRSYLYAWSEAAVEAEVAERYRHWLEQRSRGVPVAYLLGQREFWSLALAVNSSTLIPRADTELLVELALASGPAQKPFKVADLGTGSGAVALAIASERPGWSVVAVELCDSALALAERNRKELALENATMLSGSWYEPLGEHRFDLIVSNPPYLASNDPHLEEGDLPFEPLGALVAGPDGLECLEQLVAEAPEHLLPRGRLMLEHGASQGEAVRSLLRNHGFEEVQSYKDIAKHERVTVGIWLTATAPPTAGDGSSVNDHAE